EIVLGLGVNRPRLDRRLILSNGGRVVLEFREMIRVGIVRLRELRLQAERLFEFATSLVGLSGGVQRLCEVVVQASGPRPELQGAPEVAHRAGRVALREASLGDDSQRRAVRLRGRGLFQQTKSAVAVPG